MVLLYGGNASISLLEPIHIMQQKNCTHGYI